MQKSYGEWVREAEPANKNNNNKFKRRVCNSPKKCVRVYLDYHHLQLQVEVAELEKY